MKVLLLLFQLNLLNCAVSFVVRKTKIYPSKPIGFVNNLEQQSSNLAAGDIKYTFLADNQFTIDDEIPSIGNLIKSLRIPGFNVYHIVIHRDDTGNYENSKSYPKLKTQPEHIPENDHTGTHLSNIEIEKRNDSEALNYNEINKALDSENIIDQKFIEIDCDLKSSIYKEKCNEETTTNINEVTTDISLFNENSTVTSEYDYENYGSLSDRNGLSPELLASLVG